MASLLLSLILLAAGTQAWEQGAAPGPTPTAEQRVSDAAGTESIAGTVMQGETQWPLSYARIELKPEGYAKRLSGHEKPCNPARDIDDAKSSRPQYAITDANGRFSFQNIAAGRYYLSAEREGYLRGEYGQRDGVFPRGTVLEIGPQVAPARPGLSSHVLHDIVLRLYPAPTIMGRVFTEEGARVPAAIVQLYQYRFAPLNGRTLKPVRSIFADDNGDYRLFWLNPGQYIVSAAYSDYVLQPWTESLRFTPNLPDADNRYPVVFYPGVERPSDALPVAVGAVAASPLDLTLSERPRFNVAIRLVGGSMPPDTTVILVPLGGDLCAAMDYGIAPAKDGVVRLRDVPAGRYLALAVSGRASLSELRPLNVDRHIRDYQLPVTASVEIGVRYSASDTNPGSNGLPIEGARINLTRTGNEVSHVVAAESDSEGRLAFKGVGPGSYYVTTDSPLGYYLSSVTAYRWEPEDPLNPCIQLPAALAIPARDYSFLDSHGHLNRELPLIVPPKGLGQARCLTVSIVFGGRFFGRAVDRSGLPVAGALVVGLPRTVWGTDDSEVAFTPPDRYLTAISDSDGRFILTGVPARTEYKLFAFEDLDSNLVYDPDLVSRFPNRDLIQIEIGPAPVAQARSQSVQGLRSVNSGLGPFGSGFCTENFQCVLKAIPADETRALNIGR